MIELYMIFEKNFTFFTWNLIILQETNENFEQPLFQFYNLDAIYLNFYSFIIKC